LWRSCHSVDLEQWQSESSLKWIERCTICSDNATCKQQPFVRIDCQWYLKALDSRMHLFGHSLGMLCVNICEPGLLCCLGRLPSSSFI
jgi:hypothetical protein